MQTNTYQHLDTRNLSEVMRSEGIVVINNPRQHLTCAEALNLATYLVVATDSSDAELCEFIRRVKEDR